MLVVVLLGDKDENEEQLRLKDDLIFRLKQEISTKQLQIKDLEYENKDLKLSLANFKGDSTYVAFMVPSVTIVSMA